MVLFVTNGRNCQILTAPNSSFQCTNNLLWSVYSTLEWVSERGSEEEGAGGGEGAKRGKSTDAATFRRPCAQCTFRSTLEHRTRPDPDIISYSWAADNPIYGVYPRHVDVSGVDYVFFFPRCFCCCRWWYWCSVLCFNFFFTGNQRVCTKPDQRQHFWYILHHFAPVTASEGRKIGNVGDRQGRFFMEADMICILFIIGTFAYVCLPKSSSCDASPKPILFKNLLLAQPATILLMPGFRWKKNMSLFWSTLLTLTKIYIVIVFEAE